MRGGTWALLFLNQDLALPWNLVMDLFCLDFLFKMGVRMPTLPGHCEGSRQWVGSASHQPRYTPDPEHDAALVSRKGRLTWAEKLSWKAQGSIMTLKDIKLERRKFVFHIPLRERGNTYVHYDAI